MNPNSLTINIHYGGNFNQDRTSYDGGQMITFPDVDVSGFNLTRLHVWIKEKREAEHSDVFYFKEGEESASLLRYDDEWLLLRYKENISLYPIYIDWERMNPIYRNFNLYHGGYFVRNNSSYQNGQVITFRDVDVTGWDIGRLFDWLNVKIPVRHSDVMYFKEGRSSANFLMYNNQWLALRNSRYINLYAVYINEEFEPVMSDTSSD